MTNRIEYDEGDFRFTVALKAPYARMVVAKFLEDGSIIYPTPQNRGAGYGRLGYLAINQVVDVVKIAVGNGQVWYGLIPIAPANWIIHPGLGWKPIDQIVLEPYEE